MQLIALKLASIGLVAAGLVCALAACNKAAHWRDQQVAQSQRAAQNSQVVVPDQPPAVPDDVRRELPLDPGFTVVEYANNDGTVRVKALSAWDTAQTARWVLAEMERRGYATQDNPSRILEGLEFVSDQASYKALTVKVTLNTADLCVVEITGN